MWLRRLNRGGQGNGGVKLVYSGVTGYLLIRHIASSTRRFTGSGAVALCRLCLAAAFCVPGGGQQQRVTTLQNFERLAAQATAAREASRFGDAIELYRRALSLHPKWDEGWWYLATLLYERDSYAEAARAFKEAAALQPKAGAAWAMLGLCEFQLGRYDEALADIHRGRQLGLAKNPELIRVMRYHEGILSLLKGEFETAQQTLGALSYEGLSSEDLIIALGLSVLRIPALPKQIDANYRDRELIRRAGWAEHQAAQKNVGDAQREYERLAADFPKTPNVQYAYGRFLLTRRSDEEAVVAFQREIANSPEHALARLQIAYIKLKNKDAAAGVPFAKEAVQLAPRLTLAHYLLGRLFFDAGRTAEAIEELETAQHLAPDEPKIYFALARAYTRAHRKEDADRARDTFARLNQLAEQAAGQGLSRGEAIPESNGEATKPAPQQ